MTSERYLFNRPIIGLLKLHLQFINYIYNQEASTPNILDEKTKPSSLLVTARQQLVGSSSLIKARKSSSNVARQM